MGGDDVTEAPPPAAVPPERPRDLRVPLIVAASVAVGLGAAVFLDRELPSDARLAPQEGPSPLEPADAAALLPGGPIDPPSGRAGDAQPEATVAGAAPEAPRAELPGAPAAIEPGAAQLDPSHLGTLHVVTEPPGAEVRIDGNMVGTTPLTVQELAGLARIRVGKEGFRTYNRSLSIEAGQRVELGPLRLEPLPELSGTVELFGVGLEGGAVAVDGGPRLTLPARVEAASGVHRFQVFAPDGESYTVTRDVAFDTAGSTVRVDLQDL